MNFNCIQKMKLGLGKAIKKKGYTFVPLYDTTAKEEKKEAFLEVIVDAGIPKDLSEWMFNKYIEPGIVNKPVIFQTPVSVFTTTKFNAKHEYSLRLDPEPNHDFTEFMTKMDTFVKMNAIKFKKENKNIKLN